ncbi:hypothetical protein BDW74DRAFT_168902 [Aspergillus multicolor]|uniref:RTA1 domain-containing protein n=1 Tax=Aspergillus multicolor TaxID=41759 RepID=UPI003CCE24B6
MPSNATLLENTELCTLSTCPLSLGMVQYRPLLWAQILFIALFGAAIIPNLVFGIRENISYFKPRTYTITFITFDVIALILQAAGGAKASTAEPGDQDATDMGVNVMIAAAEYDLDPRFATLQSTRCFQASLWDFGIATVLIVVQSVYRCAELREGFQGHLANDEVTFMVLEATMIALAVVALTVFHPSLCVDGTVE